MNLLEQINEVNKKLSYIEGVNLDSITLTDRIDRQSLVSFEQELSYDLPDLLKNFYLNQAGSVTFNWNSDLKVFGEECKYGGINLLSSDQIKSFLDDMQWQVEEGKINEEELSNNEGLRALVEDWLHWIPIVTFENGDAFCIDKRDNTIVFMEHDVMDGGPNVHGLKIARNFDDLINNWSKIGFVDIYDWTEGTYENGIDLENPIFDGLIKKLK